MLFLGIFFFPFFFIFLGPLFFFLLMGGMFGRRRGWIRILRSRGRVRELCVAHARGPIRKR